jgi:hypothetical protein
MISAVLFF